MAIILLEYKYSRLLSPVKGEITIKLVGFTCRVAVAVTLVLAVYFCLIGFAWIGKDRVSDTLMFTRQHTYLFQEDISIFWGCLLGPLFAGLGVLWWRQGVLAKRATDGRLTGNDSERAGRWLYNSILMGVAFGLIAMALYFPDMRTYHPIPLWPTPLTGVLVSYLVTLACTYWGVNESRPAIEPYLNIALFDLTWIVCYSAPPALLGYTTIALEQLVATAVVVVGARLLGLLAKGLWVTGARCLVLPSITNTISQDR